VFGTARCAAEGAFEVRGEMNDLVIPEPEAIPAGFHLVARRVVDSLDRIDAVEENLRRLAALRAYVSKHEHRAEVQAAERWCEVRIGELLPPPEEAMYSGKKGPSLAGEGSVPREDRHKFRLLAAHRALVEKLIAEGTRSRGKLLSAIRDEIKNGRRPPSQANGDEAGRLITGDCVKGLAKLREGSVRLAFADPPYNQKVDYGRGGKADDLEPEEYLGWCLSWMEAVPRVLADDGSFWVLISDEWADHFGLMLRTAGLHRKQWLIWYESFGVNNANGFNRTHRHIFWAVKDRKRFVFNPAAVTRPSDRQEKYQDKRAEPGGKLCGIPSGASTPP
jgi:hypothetical protein